MALTGTATLAMVKEITEILGMHEFVAVKATSNRPNIMYAVSEVTRSRVQSLLKYPHSTVLHNKRKNMRISERKR